MVYIRSTPHPVTVTTRIITFLVGNPYKPSFATVTGWGVDPRYTNSFDVGNPFSEQHNFKFGPKQFLLILFPPFLFQEGTRWAPTSDK